MSEKVVMRACDLVTLLVQPSEWNYGCKIPQVKLVGPCCHIESLTDRSSQYTITSSIVIVSPADD